MHGLQKKKCIENPKVVETELQVNKLQLDIWGDWPTSRLHSVYYTYDFSKRVTN